MKYPLLTSCLTLCLLNTLLFDSLFAAPIAARKPDITIDFKTPVATRLQSLRKQPDLIHSAIGVTRKETPIPCVYSKQDLDFHTGKTRILLIGGLDASKSSVDAVINAVNWFYGAPEAAALREQFSLSAVPIANPDGWVLQRGPKNASNGNLTRGYPPMGPAYHSPTKPETEYLWRWIGMHAPDLVIDVREGNQFQWVVPVDSLSAARKLGKHLQPQIRPVFGWELVSSLAYKSPSDVGRLPALAVEVPQQNAPAFLPALLKEIQQSKFQGPSPARLELMRRLQRTPIQVATQLSKVYGNDLGRLSYLPVVSLISQIRLGELTGDQSRLPHVEQITQKYLTKNPNPLSNKGGGSVIAGHLLFSELAKATGNQQYIALAKRAADLGFDEQGNFRESMPHHVEMSDAVFMSCPILAAVGRLTGEPRYYEMALRHWRFIQKLDQRPDGVYRNSPLSDAAWGRGNGFPALGLALVLSELPLNSPLRQQFIDGHRKHLEALARHQDPTGMWHQVIDHPESYREMTSTCMITFAMIRGIREGWLDAAQYTPIIERAWNGIKTRVAFDGTLVDVCTGTGKQTSVRGYFDRMAILGNDTRGGAMAFLVSNEMAQWLNEQDNAEQQKLD
ncbi:Unsaturated rhamnogalacturonyl hydrolase YteR [Gimesia alba]|uniref:Unsaturated rhamnogalacturonyl hydrolase YteR n=1 Tax=Gimesia alba TaxID=2527973 RepID=A0A517R8A6_9PLAN|nr:glycoside hydrolase family 88 protein [Gimesia alba]QDT40105.1 Unsaturated rhamnogalacturonyl hydrolase YteR [Gimesia alba]